MGLITEREIDVSIRRLMLGRMRLGMFDPAERVRYAQIPHRVNDSPEHDRLAREVARQSMVLLKNQNNTLPLKKNLNTIAVIGPTADSVPMLVSSYNGTPSKPVTILQGIRNAVSAETRVIYAPGSPLVTELLPLEEPVPATCLFTDESRQTPGLRADLFKSVAQISSPLRTRVDATLDSDWSLPTPREPLPADNFFATWSSILVPPTTGTYQLGIQGASAFRVELDGDYIVDDWTLAGRRTMGARIHLEKGRGYQIQVDYYFSKESKKDPAIQLRWTRPDAEPYYAQAVRAAEKADAVIMVLGLTAGLERERETTGYRGFFGGDRQSLDLPAVQRTLLEAVSKTGKPVILVLTSGSALSVNWAAENTPAILQAWYPGQQGGNAVADILFGDHNPAGRLPVTFYKATSDLPPMTDYSMKNRTYRYFKGPVLYPFGHGLSYTTFTHSDLQVSPESPTDQNLTVRTRVKNTGPRPGDEVVQLYLTRVGGPDPTPIRALQSFRRVTLQPGEEKTIEFTLTPYQLSTVNTQGKREVNPGPIRLQVGPSSVGGQEQSITLTGQKHTPTYPTDQLNH
jgi:beta-glucosidase